MSRPVWVGSINGGGSILRLSIEIPAAAGYAIGFAVATGIIATALRTVWPVLND